MAENHRSDKSISGSQDAVRHAGDARHHKFPRELRGETGNRTVDEDAAGGQTQSEIPKVGSTDAPGG